MCRLRESEILQACIDEQDDFDSEFMNEEQMSRNGSDHKYSKEDKQWRGLWFTTFWFRQ